MVQQFAGVLEMGGKPKQSHRIRINKDIRSPEIRTKKAPASPDRVAALVEANPHLPMYIIGKWLQRKTHVNITMDRDDMISAAMTAMMRAASKYDPSRGYKFCTFAGRIIWVEMNRLAFNHLNRMRRRPADWDPSVMSRRLAVPDGEEVTLAEKIDRAREMVDSGVLTEREEFVLRSRSEGGTLREIAKPLGISYQMVKIIQQNAVEALNRAYHWVNPDH